jgi:PPK2 family polyphosphate:nucleotide phosphotransferase
LNAPLKKQVDRFIEISRVTRTHSAIFPSEAPRTFAVHKQSFKKLTQKTLKQISRLQEKLYAESKNKLLIIFQAMDTAGKDSTIARIFSGLNPQGVRVTGFKVPSKEELAHDYLWRVHREVPSNGQIGIFNRSHYEDVLAVRVNSLAPEAVWKKRYQHIKDFEKMLVDEGTVILKFYLSISYEEQAVRLKERQADPKKNWKYNPSDWEERKKWPAYMEAYREAITKTSSSYAPWFVIPANQKWFRDMLVSQIIFAALKKINPQFPRLAEAW